jgi:hypothetical protein
MPVTAVFDAKTYDRDPLRRTAASHAIEGRLPRPMKRPSGRSFANLRAVLAALAVSVFVAGCAATVPARVDESELLALGFHVLVATTTVQQEWIQTLPPGQIRPMQRNGRKFFIFPDASRKLIYVGGPREFAAYQQRHPGSAQGESDAADRGAAYTSKEYDAMRAATARDLSDPFLGASWIDLGW